MTEILMAECGMRDLFILTGKMSDSFENDSGIRVKNRKSHVLSS